MEHGKLHPPKFGSGLIQRPLPPPGAIGRPAYPEPPSRNRISRPIARKRRTNNKVHGPKLSLDDSATVILSRPFQRDTSAEAFAAPRRHAGDRAFHFSPKLLALGASVLFFAVFAMGYTGSRRAPQDAPAARLAVVSDLPAPEGAALARGVTTEPPVDAGTPSVISASAPESPLLAVAASEKPTGEPIEFSTPGVSPETEAAPIAEPPTTLSSAGEPSAAEEPAFPSESRLLAVATRPENADPLAAEPALLSTDEPRHAPASAGGTSAVQTRRPWEFAADQESDLALNGFTRKGAPWSFNAGAVRTGEGDLASLFHRPSVPKAITPAVQAAAAMSVMILGDSLALCGFGSRLDRHFREAANVRSTNTYMACGTTPLSWLKEKPFTNLKAYCGFWTIESPRESGNKPVAMQDTYGQPRGNKPKAHPVPKLDDLVAKAAPDVLILQTGTNLFSLFRDAKTVQPERHGPMLRRQIQPFLSEIHNLPNAPRRIYWVASPTSGRVSREIQEFVLKQVTELAAVAAPMVTVIDSRKLVTYPYKHMEPDKEHFTGSDMDQWADRVFDIVQRDLAEQVIPPARGPVATAGDASTNEATRSPDDSEEEVPSQDGELRLMAKLVGKSKPISMDQLRPYNESMVSFVYEVQQVTQGEYSEKRVVVMRPAHVDRKVQTLPNSKLGQTYELRLHELESSPWIKEKSNDDFKLNDLPLYILAEDEAKFPVHAR